MMSLPTQTTSVLRVCIGLGFFGYIFFYWGDGLEVAQFVQTAWVVPAAVAITFLGATIEALRLGLLCQSQGATLAFPSGYQIVTIGAFFNFCVPGGTGGDVAKLYYLAAENPGKGVELAMVLLVDRATGLVSLLVLIVGFALLNLEMVLDQPVLAGLLLLCVAVLAGVAGLFGLAFSRRFRESFLFPSNSSGSGLFRLFRRAADSLYAFRDHKLALVWATALSFVGHLGLAGIFLAAAHALGFQLPGSMTCYLGLVGMLANALPITPGGIGVGEAAFEGLFRLVGYSGAAQLLLVWRVSMLPITLIGGALYIVGARNRSRFNAEAADIPGTRSSFSGHEGGVSGTEASNPGREV
jgi:hypothetical protein